MDDPYNKIQLQSELEIIFFIKSISSCAKVKHIANGPFRLNFTDHMPIPASSYV